MTTSARLAASCLLVASPLLAPVLARAAEEPPAIVIERAPEAGDSPAANDSARAESERLAAQIADLQTKLQTAQATIDVLTTKNQQLDSTLTARTSELRDVKGLLAAAETRAKELAAARSGAASASAEKARADEATARLNTLVAGASRLQEEKAALESQLAQARETESSLRQQLAAASAAAANNDPSAPSPEIAARLAELEGKLETALRSYSLLEAENARLKSGANDATKLSGELESLRAENASLESRLAAPPPPDLSARLAATEDKLNTTLRSFSLLQAENDRLKAQADELAQLRGELDTLRADKASLEARLAETSNATSAPPPADLAQKLAAAEDKLNTTLRSYSLLQSENDRLRAEAAQAAASAHDSAAKSASENAAQVSALFDELRQTKAQLASLAAENSQLKTRLALSGPPPGPSLASPTRPGAPRTEVGTPNSEPATQNPQPNPAPRQHTVVLGDTLAKISRQYYGTPGRWDEILEANRDVIQNENALTVGTTLRIP